MRTLLMAAGATILVLAAPTASAGGGWSSFEFDDEYVEVGDTVTGRTAFQERVRGTGSIEDGPWHAYLLREGTWINPSRIPDEAIPLGPIDIRGGGRLGAVATITFTVPDVALGGYNIGLCDVPCTESMVGDLGGGWLWITRTEEGATLLREVHRTETLLYRFRSSLGRRVREVERPAADLETRLDRLEGSIELRLGRLEDRLNTSLAADQETGETPWVIAISAIVLAAAVLFAGRRRRLRLDPIPQEPPVVEWEVPEEVSART
jgi:hypothetical protein